MIGIVILNYNSWEETLNCIDSIIKNTNTEYRIYLVDNASPKTASDEEILSLKNRGVDIIFNDQNTGYAAGNNVGLLKAYKDGCDQFIICNPDVRFVDNSIEVMSRFAKKDDSIGIVGPLLYDPSGDFHKISMLSKLTAFGKIKNMFLSTPLKPLFKRFDRSFYADQPFTEPKEVFSVAGSCFLITKQGYDKVFPFDEHTFLYEEEYILGCRLEEAKLKAFIVPNTKVVHSYAASTGGIHEFTYKCLLESEQYYLKEYIHSRAIPRTTVLLLRKIIWIIKYKR